MTLVCGTWLRSPSGQAVALERIDRQIDAQGPQQPDTGCSGGDHHMIDSDLLPADTHGTHAATVAGQRSTACPVCEAERWRGPQPLQQLVAEPLAIGDLVTWRVDAALQCGAQWRQCRFDLHTLSRIQQPLTGPLIQRHSAFGELARSR